SNRAITAVTTRRTTEKDAFHRADGLPRTGGASQRIDCDAVISALPVQALRRILDAQQMETAGLRAIARLGTVSAISATLSLDRRIHGPTGVPLVAGCSIRDIADLSSRHADPTQPSVFQLMVSRTAGADILDDDRLVRLLHRDLQRVWPPASGTTVKSATVD